jgi:uncharacterized membrane protein YkoI
MRRSHGLTILVLAAALVSAEAQAQQLTGNPTRGPASAREAQLRPKIAQDAARSVALARVPHGTVAASDLKTEHGVLVYIFDIAVPGEEGLEELQISAADGSVVSARHLGPRGTQSASVTEKVGSDEPPR